MGETTGIQWTDATWNPWHGCHKVSPGCKYCYMFREKARYGQDGNMVSRSKTTFNAPLKWKEPKLIFTCSWSDWFVEEANPWRGEAEEIIRKTPQHTYQILTKRPERIAGNWPVPPLPNVWLGVSVESLKYKYRIDQLRETPAATRFISFEPLLENVGIVDLRGIHWVIVGGESGPGARPMHPDWVRSIRDQCVAAGVPFFFKQWGEWQNGSAFIGSRDRIVFNDGRIVESPYAADVSQDDRNRWHDFRPHVMAPVGKKAAGRSLDGRTWDELPAGGAA